MKKLILLLSLFFGLVSKSHALIEVDITRGNLDPLPIAVSPLHVDVKSQKYKDIKIKELGENISNIIENYTSKVRSGTAPMRSERIPLRWGEGYNTYSMFDYRVSLAVAGGGLFLDYEKTEKGYKIKCKITIDVKYSEDYRLDVFSYKGMRLYIDEAIFTALQELGWFHPFYAHYHWTLEV